jgi:mRNA interferase MazF
VAGDLSWGEIRFVEMAAPNKKRPALVLTRGSVLRHLSQVVVAPITRTVRGIPAELAIGEECGLKEPSAAKLDQLQSVRRDRIGRLVGTLDPARKRELREAVLYALGLDDA